MLAQIGYFAWVRIMVIGKKMLIEALALHKKECIICGEKLIVDVHHFNLNHDDNRVENLVPLCPTHHKYIHSRHAHLITEKMNEYVTNFKNRV